MWAWLIQRAAAMVLLVVVAVHLVNPFRRGVQAALLLLVPRPRAPRRARGAPRLRPAGALAPGALRPGAGALGGDLFARVGGGGGFKNTKGALGPPPPSPCFFFTPPAPGRPPAPPSPPPPPPKLS